MQAKLGSLLSEGFSSPTRSYDMYMQAYKSHKDKASSS